MSTASAAPSAAATLDVVQAAYRAFGARDETDFVHLVEVHEGRIARFTEFFDTFVAAEAFRPARVACRAEWHATTGRSTLPPRLAGPHAQLDTEVR